MIYVLTLCLGITWGYCDHFRQFEFLTIEACEKERALIPRAAIGKGYAVCEPRKLKDTQ